jgi:hypothetical protein
VFGNGNLRDRLSSAVYILMTVRKEEFDEKTRPQWIELELLLRKKHQDNPWILQTKGLWATNVTQMHDKEKKRCAQMIFELYVALIED